MPTASPPPGPVSSEVAEIERALTRITYLSTRARQHERLMGLAGVPLDRAAVALLRQIADCTPQRPSELAHRLGVPEARVVIARALIGRPTMLLLDEPSLGLAPLISAQILESLVQLNKSDGLSVLMVEQNVTAALSIADRGYVIASGSVVLSGTGAELAADPTVREHYLGSLSAQEEEK